MNDEFYTLFHVQLAVREVYKLCAVFQIEAMALLFATKTSTCGLLIAVVSTLRFIKSNPLIMFNVCTKVLFVYASCLYTVTRRLDSRIPATGPGRPPVNPFPTQLFQTLVTYWQSVYIITSFHVPYILNFILVYSKSM